MSSDLPFTLINAFATTTSPHSGNQASIVILPGPDDPRAEDSEWMLKIARDFNLSETAYIVPLNLDPSALLFGLRWFTPAAEVALCGHATLAAARALFNLYPSVSELIFKTQKAGFLSATRISDSNIAENQATEIAISLPTLSSTVLAGIVDSNNTTTFTQIIEGFLKAVNGDINVKDLRNIAEFKFGERKSLVVEVREDVDIAGLKVEASEVLKIANGLLIVTQQLPPTSPSTLKIASRVFAPGFGIDEDPVTGSAHAYLAGYYLLSPVSKRLNLFSPPPTDVKEIKISAVQLSERVGEIELSLLGDEEDDEGRRKVRLVGKTWVTGKGTLTTF